MSKKFAEINSNEELKKIVGRNLKNCRQKRLISQTDLGYFSEVDHTTISRYESGKNMIYLPHLLKFAKVLEIEPSELLEGWEKIFQ